MADEPLYLTELILCIQHEVQSAVDFIASKAQAPSELGQSSAVMAVETLRVKVPFQVDVVRRKGKVVAAPVLATLTAVDGALARRRGLALDIGKTGGYATFLKLQVLPQGSETPTTAASGEIEMTFAAVERPS